MIWWFCDQHFRGDRQSWPTDAMSKHLMRCKHFMRDKILDNCLARPIHLDHLQENLPCNRNV